MREEPAAPEATEGDEGEACRLLRVWGNELLPKTLADFFDEASAGRDGVAAITGAFEFLLNAGGLLGVEFAKPVT